MSDASDVCCFDYNLAITAHFVGDMPDAIFVNVIDQDGGYERKLIWQADRDIHVHRARMMLLAEAIRHYNARKGEPPIIAVAA